MMSIYDANGRRFKSKAALKAAKGQGVIFEETSMFGAEFKGAGTYTIVGPEPYKRNWFAQVTVDASRIVQKVS